MVTEWFARVNVGKMNFDERDGGGRQRIAQGDAGVGVRAGLMTMKST
jgi:hypothetical protein